MSVCAELMHAAGLADVAAGRARDLDRALQALSLEMRQDCTNPASILKRVSTVSLVWEELRLLMRAGRMMVVESEGRTKEQAARDL